MRRILPLLTTGFLLIAAAFYSVSITSCQNVANSTDTTIHNNGHTIQGHVYDAKGYPFRGVKVYSSKTNYTTTLIDGYFSLSNITYPVTLMLLKDGDSTLNVYQNLNANNPNLTYNSYSDNTNYQEGAFIVHYPAIQPGRYLMMAFASEDITSFSYNYSIGDSVQATVPITWQGDKRTILGKLILMTYQRNLFQPFLISSFDTYAERTFYIDTLRIINTTFVGTDFNTNPEEAVVNVKNYNFSSSSDNRIYFSLAGNTNSDLFLDNYNFRGSFNFIVPKIFANNRMHITTTAPYTTDSYIANNAFTPENSIVVFNGIPEIALINPPLNGTNVDSTTSFFVKGNTTSVGVYQYNFNIEGNFLYSVWIYSASDTFTYPDLSAFGFNLRRGTNYKWSVQKMAPFGNLDDYCSVPTNKILKNFDTQGNASYFSTRPPDTVSVRPRNNLMK